MQGKPVPTSMAPLCPELKTKTMQKQNNNDNERYNNGPSPQEGPLGSQSKTASFPPEKKTPLSPPGGAECDATGPALTNGGAFNNRKMADLSAKRPLSIVIHKCTIITSGVKLGFNPQDEQDRLSLNENWSVSLSNQDKKATIEYNYNSIIVQASRCPDDSWKVDIISADFQRLAFNHSGEVLDVDEVFLKSLQIYLELMNYITSPESFNRCLPGIVRGCCSYWSNIEICIQVQDPDEFFLHRYKHSTHLRISSEKIRYDGESITWKGSEFKFIIYRKDVQLEDAYFHHIEPEDRDVIRFEGSFKKGVLVKQFKGQKGLRLTTFSLVDAYWALRRAAEGFKGVYRTTCDKSKLKGIIPFLLDLLVSGDTSLTLVELVDRYADINGTSRKHRNDILNDLSKAYASVEGFAISELFPEFIPRSYKIRPRRKVRAKQGGFTGEVRPILDNLANVVVDDDIAVAYSRTSFIEYEHFKTCKSYGRPDPTVEYIIMPEADAFTQKEVQDGTPAHPVFPTPPKPC